MPGPLQVYTAPPLPSLIPVAVSTSVPPAQSELSDVVMPAMEGSGVTTTDTLAATEQPDDASVTLTAYPVDELTLTVAVAAASPVDQE